MNFYEEMKKYFETTPQNKILEDWDETIEFDKTGATFESILERLSLSADTTMFYRKVEAGYFGFIPEINGVATQGKTLDELKENLLDAKLAMQLTNKSTPS